MPETLAPSTFRTPISFVLRSAVYAARPNKPKHEIIIASAANTRDNLLMSISLKNMLIELVIYKLVFKGISGIIFFHYRGIFANAFSVLLCGFTLTYNKLAACGI